MALTGQITDFFPLDTGVQKPPMESFITDVRITKIGCHQGVRYGTK